MMTWGFIRGQEYNRRRDIHARFGGQWQGGIITPAKHNVIFIMTGKRGAEFGYDDHFYDDGRIDYFGEGQEGDMEMVRGNRAIAEHVENGKDLLWFEKEQNRTSRHVVYRGEYLCAGWRWGQSRDGKGTMRRAIIFELHPLENVVEKVDVSAQQIAGDLVELRRRAFDAAGVATSKQVTRTIFERSQDVRDYVLARAGSNCEGCGALAPFRRPNGAPYLEPHHIRRVSDGGPDDPRYVIGLCPTCHRRVHHGDDGSAYNEQLMKTMARIERPRWV